ncbi:MAG: iron-sulfur cluster assembly scaffold protein [bacterium]
MSAKHPQGYSERLLDHFLHPRHVGAMPDADGSARVGDPSCGDVLEVWIRVDDQQRLTDVTFKCRGCPTAIACASAMTELAIGADLDQAAEIADEQVEEALGGLPAAKRHCSNLAADALHEAIFDHVGRALRPGSAARRS